MSDEHVHEADALDLDHGTWARVQSGTRMFLGRVHLLDLDNPYVMRDVIDLDGSSKDTVKQSLAVKEVLAAKIITLMPSFELICDTKRVPIMGPDGKIMMEMPGVPMTGLSREPVVAGLDFALHPVPHHIKTIDHVYLLSELHTNDVGTYRHLIRAADARNQKFREAALKQSSGIVSPADAAAEMERARRAGRRG